MQNNRSSSFPSEAASRNIIFTLVRRSAAYERFVDELSTSTFPTDNALALHFDRIIIPWTQVREEDKVWRIFRGENFEERKRKKGEIKIRSSIFSSRDNGRLLTRNKRNRRVKSNRISRTSTIHLRLNDIGRDRSADGGEYLHSLKSIPQWTYRGVNPFPLQQTGENFSHERREITTELLVNSSMLAHAK